LLDETLVVTMGEMGRTPAINKSRGRDHWTFWYSVLLAGAGIKGGTGYGAAGGDAADMQDNPVRTRGSAATIYQGLGSEPEMLVSDRGGRPLPVSNGGKAVTDILA